jgi:hypothetical protein
MPITQAAVGYNVRDFATASDLNEVWAFINLHMSNAQVERPIVLRDDEGQQLVNCGIARTTLRTGRRHSKCALISTWSA